MRACDALAENLSKPLNPEVLGKKGVGRVETKPRCFNSHLSSSMCGVYGVVWCDMVWYGVLWCGVVCCDIVLYSVVRCNMVWYNVVWCDMVLYSIVPPL